MNRILYLFAFSLIVFSACRSSKPVAPSFFIIEYPADRQQSDTLTPLPFSLQIQDVDVHPAYGTTQIAIREEKNKINYFVNNQWASRPQQNFERFTVTYLSRNNIFQTTERRFWNDEPDYRLYISVYNMEVVRDNKDFTARLHLEFRLETLSGEIIDRHISDNFRLLEKRDLNLFATAINNIFYEELNYFAKRIHFMLLPA